MEQSILKSTKKVLGIDPADPSFDQDILTHINSAFSHLQQLGIGPEIGFVIQDDTPKWSDFLHEETPLYILSAVKTNMFLHVRYIFDPPQLQHVLAAMERQIQESDVRLSMMREAIEWVNPNPVVAIVDGGDPTGE
jgi:hypothetical protein